MLGCITLGRVMLVMLAEAPEMTTLCDDMRA